MKIIIREYLRNLKERDELEDVVVDLLSLMGLKIVSEPARGTKQSGVDVFAVGRMPGDKEPKAYLISIKSGDIKRTNWKGGPQRLRDSLEEIRDDYINSSVLLQNELKRIPRVVVGCFGGVVGEEVRKEFDGWFKNQNDQNARRRKPLVSFVSWNGDVLAENIVKKFLSPRLFVGDGARYLTKALAMVEDPDVSYSFFARYLQLALGLKSTALTATKRRRLLSQVGLALCLLRHYCGTFANLDVAYRSSELTLLWVWEFLKAGRRGNGRLTRAAKRKRDDVFGKFWNQYDAVASAYVKRILPTAKLPYVFSWVCRPNCEVDVNKRLFDVIGRMASYGSALLMHSAVNDKGESCTPSSKVKKAVGCIAETIGGIIKNNPTSDSPYLEEFVTEISLVALFLLQVGADEALHSWLWNILQNVRKHYIFHRSYPVYAMDYRQLVEHVRRGIQPEEKERHAKSSVLFPMIALIAVVAGFEDCFNEIVALKKELLQACDFQVWYPDERLEDEFYVNSARLGHSKPSVAVDNPAKFLQEVFSELEHSKMSLSCLGTRFAGLTMIGFRHYRYPLPPSYFHAIAGVRCATGVKEG